MIFAEMIAECRLALESDVPFDPKKRAHLNIKDLQLPQAVRDRMDKMKAASEKPKFDPNKRIYPPAR